MNLLKDQPVILDDRVKGTPGGMRPISSADVGELNWNIIRDDLPLPLGFAPIPRTVELRPIGLV